MRAAEKETSAEKLQELVIDHNVETELKRVRQSHPVDRDGSWRKAFLMKQSRWGRGANVMLKLLPTRLILSGRRGAQALENVLYYSRGERPGEGMGQKTHA